MSFFNKVLSSKTVYRLPDDILDKFREIVGKRNLLSKGTDLLLYSYDAAINRAYPSAVLLPENVQQVSSIVKICSQNKIPFVARGAGTNLCGSTIPLHNAVVIATTKMKRIISIDKEKRIAIVEPGLPNVFLQKALANYGLLYAPDPASQKSCTIGGNIGANAGGPHCLKYGVTSHHVLSLEIVLSDGEIVELDTRNPGYDLTGFFVGSEGTLGIVTRAALNLIPAPKNLETMLVSFHTLESAIRTVTEIISHGIIPSTLEAVDKMAIQAVEGLVHAGYPLNAEAVLLIEVDGDSDLKAQVEEIKQICQKNDCMDFRLAKDEKEREQLWEGRRGVYPALARLAPNVLVEDGTVPRTLLPETLKKIRAIADEYGVRVSMIFHAGDGNVHPQILFDERDEEQTAKVRKAGYEMLKICVDAGGTISGEHGIGMEKREAMKWLFTPETLTLFRRIKNVFDPNNLCNPGKLIPLEEGGNSWEFGATHDSRSPAAWRVQSQKFIYQGKTQYAEPQNEPELSEFLRLLHYEKKKVFIRGNGTRLKDEVHADCFLSTKLLNKIIEHDVENFTVTVEAGINIDQLQKDLGTKNQKILFQSSGTVGGIIASNSSQRPPICDQILGMKVALADGTIVQFGAKVMKNVAGYDAAKLLLGSWGSLGVIVSVILKTYPKNYNASVMPASKNSFREVPEILIQLYRKVKRAFDPENIFIFPFTNTNALKNGT